MKTALLLCLALLCATTAAAQTQVTAETYTVTSFDMNGGGGTGTMVFASDGTFIYDSASGTFTGFFLETDDPATGAPVRYAIYLDGQDQMQYVYAQTTTIDLSGIPVLLIYGVSFGNGEFWAFGGYSFSFDLSSLLGLGSLPF